MLPPDLKGRTHMTDERDDADSGQLASAAARLGKRGGMVRAKVLPP